MKAEITIETQRGYDGNFPDRVFYVAYAEFIGEDGFLVTRKVGASPDYDRVVEIANKWLSIDELSGGVRDQFVSVTQAATRFQLGWALADGRFGFLRKDWYEEALRERNS